MGIPCFGPGSEALTFWGGCVLGIAAGQEKAPRPRGTRVPGPRTPSLTGAGVSAGRRLRRRRRCRRSGETRGPNRKCRPFPPTPHQPRASCPEAEVAPVPPKRRRGGWRTGNGEGKLRRHSVSRHGRGEWDSLGCFRWANGACCACAQRARFLGHHPQALAIRLGHTLGLGSHA